MNATDALRHILDELGHLTLELDEFPDSLAAAMDVASAALAEAEKGESELVAALRSLENVAVAITQEWTIDGDHGAALEECLDRASAALAKHATPEAHA